MCVGECVKGVIIEPKCPHEKAIFLPSSVERERGGLDYHERSLCPLLSLLSSLLYVDGWKGKSDLGSDVIPHLDRLLHPIPSDPPRFRPLWNSSSLLICSFPPEYKTFPHNVTLLKGRVQDSYFVTFHANLSIWGVAMHQGPLKICIFRSEGWQHRRLCSVSSRNIPEIERET